MSFTRSKRPRTCMSAPLVAWLGHGSICSRGGRPLPLLRGPLSVVSAILCLNGHEGVEPDEPLFLGINIFYYQFSLKIPWFSGPYIPVQGILQMECSYQMEDWRVLAKRSSDRLIPEIQMFASCLAHEETSGLRYEV